MRAMNQRTVIESKKYKKKVQSLLKPQFPMKTFYFSPTSRDMLLIFYNKWIDARKEWLKIEPAIEILHNRRSFADLKRNSKWFHLIQPLIQNQINVLKSPNIFECSFPMFARTRSATLNRSSSAPFPAQTNADNVFSIKIHVVFPPSFPADTTPALYKSILEKMYTWLSIIYQYKPAKSCSLHLHVYLYLMDIPKWINGNGLSDNNTDGILGEENANTGYTFACQSENEIHIYRFQEWYKVFIHETMHALGIDFTHDDRTIHISHLEVQKLFPRVHVPRIRLSETYSEMWAVSMYLMYMCMGSIKLKKHARAFENVILSMETMVHLEIIFILFQCVKIIQYNSDGFVTYRDMIMTPSTQYPNIPSSYKFLPYRQNTPIFEYYVIRSILFFHLNAFFEWCSKTNYHGEITFDTSSVCPYGKSAIHSFVELIRKCYREPVYVHAMRFIEIKVEALKNKKMKRTFKNRLSAYQFMEDMSEAHRLRPNEIDWCVFLKL